MVMKSLSRKKEREYEEGEIVQRLEMPFDFEVENTDRTREGRSLRLKNVERLRS